MSRLCKTIVGAALFAGMSLANAATATYTFVGSWNVYNDAAPDWLDSAYDGTNGPLAYTAQEAAALLYGGSASDYVISTVSADAADINFMGWYFVIGYGSAQFAQDYDNKYMGMYYGPVDSYTPNDINAAASAFIRDNKVEGLNYAFRVTPVPEPETFGLLMAGLGAMVMVRRKKFSA